MMMEVEVREDKVCEIESKRIERGSSIEEGGEK